MKCESCGANFRSKELACPYCGTPNPKGAAWSARRKAAREEHERAVREAGVAIGLLTFNRIVNRVLLAAVIFLGFLIAGAAAYFVLSDGASSLSGRLNRSENTAMLEQLYEEERFAEMYVFLDERGLMGEDYYEYSQMALLYYDYESFLLARMSYFQERDQEISEYTAYSLVNSMHDVFEFYMPAYPELTPRNEQHLKGYREDVERFAGAVLGFSGEEMALLEEEYLMTEEEERLEAAILERRAG